MKKGAGEAAAKVAGAVTSAVSVAKKTATKVAGKVQSTVSSVKQSVSDGWNKLKSAFSSKSSPKNADVKANSGATNTDAVKGGSKTPSEIARSWQGSGKYPGIDEYTDVTVNKGSTLYRGEPNGTEYFTTLDAIESSGRNATTIFEGLQVEKNPIHGYRGEMQGYLFNEDVVSAYGITKANPQFGKGGLPQYFVPNAQEMINRGALTPVDKIKLLK